MREDLAQLVAKIIAFDKERVRRGAKTFVAGQKDPALGARELEHGGAIDGRVENSVGAHQPQPSRQTREHPISCEFRNCVHRGSITIQRLRVMALNENSVNFTSGQLALEGRLAKPSGVAAARAAVICHPHPLYGGSMDNNVVEAMLEAFWKLGFATLRFNFRGVGRSQGEHAGGAGEADDAKSAMRFLLSQAGLAQDKSVMAGYSFGAAIAMRAGLEMREAATIAAVALPVAMGDFSSTQKVTKKIVLIAGDRDTYCPERAITDLAEKIGAQLRVIKGADHFFGGYEAGLTRALEEMVERSS